ncbi:transcriptional repressor p66-beta [Cimex lectularius]|uniref:Transcriptional repressor p66 coiled-coil MBD2-interaction domain-containing protein n=1 Tax=Cimex lectularius TaxID=79782 RepID=A0A8I6THC1_CIMLE|nr:transcriptional repressor p66-beta [Cimex lectularius]
MNLSRDEASKVASKNPIIGSGRRVNAEPSRSGMGWPPRRSLRPRTELRSYAESPDIVVVSDDEPKTNGYFNGACETDDEDLPMPPLPPLKELTDDELCERKKVVRRLRDELRNEEMTLVLLKKLRQSHQMKENIAVVAPCTAPQAATPTHTKQVPPPRTSSKPPASVQPSVHHLLRQPSLDARGPPTVHVPPPIPSRSHSSSVPSLHQSNSMPRNSLGGRNMGMGYPPERKDPRHSPVPPVAQQLSGNIDKVGLNMSITPVDQDRMRMDESQTPAQRQAAAKLALRKQLEKTLLQIPPPKPPPPEMHFIPNPSNTEFIYLVGLEHVVDFITKDNRSPPPPEPFRCSQCSTNFTPVWKWEKGSIKNKEPRVICEQCVTSNVKKALKAEHTNRLKTAFVKALQQEQEIEQRLAQGSPQPEPPVPPQPLVKPATPKPPPGIPSPNRDHLAKLADTAKFNPHHAAAALHQQLLRGLPQHQPLPAHMLPFSPLLYPYQLAMAQAAGGKGPVAAAAANIAELQRQAVDIQRQYLLDMIPASLPGSVQRSGSEFYK